MRAPRHSRQRQGACYGAHATPPQRRRHRAPCRIHDGGCRAAMCVLSPRA